MKNLVGKNRMKQHGVAFRLIRKKLPVLLYAGLSVCDYCDYENIGAWAFYIRDYRKDGITKGAFLFCKDCTDAKNWEKEDIFNEPQILPVFVIDGRAVPINAEVMSINYKNLDTKIYRGDVGGISVYDAYNPLLDSVVTVDRTKYAGRPDGTWKGSLISTPEKLLEATNKDSQIPFDKVDLFLDDLKRCLPVELTKERIEEKQMAEKKREESILNTDLHTFRLRCFKQCELLKSNEQIKQSKKNFGEFQKEVTFKLSPAEELKALSYYYNNDLYLLEKYRLFIGDGGLAKKW